MIIWLIYSIFLREVNNFLIAKFKKIPRPFLQSNSRHESLDDKNFPSS